MKKLLIILIFSLPLSLSAQPAQIKKNSSWMITLQKKLAQGWNTWNTRSVLSQVLLPEKFSINLFLKDLKSGDILKEALIGRRGVDVENVIPGPHAYNGSYSELTVNWKNISVNVKTAAGNKNLSIVITPDTTNNSGILLVKPAMIWGKKGKIKLTKNGFEFICGSEKLNFHINSESKISFNDSILICPLSKRIILSSYANKNAGEIESLVAKAGRKLAKTKESFGTDSSLYDAMQTVLAWDVIYEPEQNIVISPVSRIWNCNWNGWVLFDWDTYFASYMYSFDNKELAYANAAAISKNISKKGFIPNFASALGKSEDRSQPPVGSYVVWNIYKRYKEKLFLSEVFNELLSWNRWWNSNRQIEGYLCWGSDPYDSNNMPDWLTKEIGKKQAAKWESGLDNSPMYDDAVFDSSKHRLMLADVGLISMYIWDCHYLSKIAETLGKNDIKTELDNRADKYSKKLESLFDKDAGIFLNKNLATGKLSNRLSPTLFYTLLTGVPSLKQAERMIVEHFYNPNEFWGNWIMPSVSRNDSAFNDNNYWRGRIWAPMNFLVYCGLKNYNLPRACKDLVEKSEELILKSWLGEHHVYENYNSVTGEGDDVENSDKFYHWGALLAFMKLLEDEK